MLKVILLLSIGLIFASLPYVNTATIDPNTANQNDCFVRIYAEAMIPPERTFRTSDTSSVRLCQELCEAEGNRCQTFSLGISARGNGTCQLSGERISENAGRRPRGTLYDPDFNLYQRKVNCRNDGNDVTGSTGGTLPTILPTTFSSDAPPSTVLTSTYPDRMPPANTQLPTEQNDDGQSSYDNSAATRPHRPAASTDDRPNVTSADMPYTPSITNEPPNTDLYTNELHPSTMFTSTPLNYGETKPGYNPYPYPPQYPSKNPNYYQDIYTMYGFPMLYGNAQHPGSNTISYASNVPSIGTPESTITYYGNPMTTTSSMSTTQMTGGRPHTDMGSGGVGGGGSSSTTPYMGNGWSNADDINRRKPNGEKTTPSMPHGYGYDGVGNGLGTTRYPEGKPGGGYYNDRPWRPPAYEFQRPCFRRALAGKRVAPQWIRQTLVCERVEDCQAECSHEKRFVCEGFNYRLDPTGQGQGICELIDVSLEEMDIYSSPDRRDETLLYHPDYDYYERDRNACRPSFCKDCSQIGGGIGGGGGVGKPYLPEPPIEPGYNDRNGPSSYHQERPSHFTGGKPYLPAPPPDRPTTYRPIDNFKPYYDARPPSHDSGYTSPPNSYHTPPYPDTAVDKYRPPPKYESSPSHSYAPRPPPPSSYSDERPYEYDRYEYRPPRPAHDPDRYDVIRPIHRPAYTEISIYNERQVDDDYRPHRRPPPPNTEYGPPPPRPLPSQEYGPPPPPPNQEYGSPPVSFGYRPRKPERLPQSHHGGYLDRDRENRLPPAAPPPPRRKQPQAPYVPYTINHDSNEWQSHGSSYGNPNSYHPQKPGDFDYFSLGNNRPEDNSVLSYPGSGYDKGNQRNKDYYGNLWTRRPGPDECSVKSSEGFRLHKTVVRIVLNVPTVTECERMCHSENKFHCFTYSYRYAPLTHENCLLCDRPLSQLDYYSDIEPDRNFDIYAMSDDPHMCPTTALIDPNSRQGANAQCFFRAIDGTRFFKSIVRDSLNVRSVGECEMECIKSSKFTCRAFSFRYGPKMPGSIIDNCQLSDWPVIDMDKDRHLVDDKSFDVFERASYGHGCEIHPIEDDKHKKLCYLGYGSPAKLLSKAIKKVVSVPTERDCKDECTRFRETSSFRCYSFSFGSEASTFNCEMSDLDQSQLKLDVHFAHSNDRDHWLFAWNPFDLTCRDKVATIGGPNRVNNDRRMDVFRDPDGGSTWRHFTVSGKACRIGSSCEKNLVTGFHSCETEGGEVGSWDYCCRSDYPCGYSHGFTYPWCFVGDDVDQWRTCSDRYYPITVTTIANNHLASSDNNHVVSSDTNTIKKKVSAISYTSSVKPTKYHQDPPRPGGLQNLEDIAAARLWPITYIYSSGPPNATELSNVVDCNEESC